MTWKDDLKNVAQHEAETLQHALARVSSLLSPLRGLETAGEFNPEAFGLSKSEMNQIRNKIGNTDNVQVLDTYRALNLVFGAIQSISPLKACLEAALRELKADILE